MGTFSVAIGVGDLGGRRFEALDALVDTGSTYLLVPRPVLESLGIRPQERWPFTMADARTVDHDVAPVLLRIDGRTLPVLCVFGDAASQPLLGAVALETFRFAPDPVRRQLVPVPGLLM